MLVFLGLNFLCFGLCSALELKDALSLSADRPWGIITSVFVHENPDHLLNNVYGFLTWMAFFIIFTSSLPPKDRRTITLMLFLVAFGAAFLTNAIELIMWELKGTTNLTSRGASGMVYAVLGITYSVASLSSARNWERFLRALQSLRSDRLNVRAWGAAGRGALNLSFIIVIPLRLLLAPAEFFGMAPGIDVLGHSLGFLFGLVGFFAVWAIKRMW